MSRAGHEVVVYDTTPDVGGAWSATRRYPGVTTQSPKDTYTFSDFPMPAEYPEWPEGAQVQAYVEAYVENFGLQPLLRLNTEVRRATPIDGGWDLQVRDLVGGSTRHEIVEHLVVANGVFSQSVMPRYAGAEEFTAAGGQLIAANEFHDTSTAVGAHAVVVGYGKSSCDVALEISRVAAETHVIARQLLWKVPRRLHGVLNFKYLLLTRLGEGLFGWEHLRGVEKFLHGPADGLRRRMLNSVGDISVKMYDLEGLGLVPRGSMEHIIRSAIGLVTDGFFEQVTAGRIEVHRDTVITRLSAVDGVPHAELADASLVRADLLVCATGYTQSLPFFDDEVVDALTDERGNFALYRQSLPVSVPNLSFTGYNSSFFSPLNAEIGAIWVAATLTGLVRLPARGDARTH